MNRIFFLTPHVDRPIGGNKVIYRHVDILNHQGFDAYVLHLKDGFRCSWFKNDTKIAYPAWNWVENNKFLLEILKSKLKGKFGGDRSHLMKVSQIQIIDDKGNRHPLPPLDEGDILVFPDYISRELHQVYKKQPYVIFNQRAYISFSHCQVDERGQKLKRNESENLHFYGKELKGILVVSEDNQDYLSYVFPNTKIARVHLSLDSKLFYLNANKKKQIAFMPRRGLGDAQQVIAIIKELNLYHDWQICPIVGLPENEVAEIMRESALFMSFSQEEGFGLPPFEAMACGCIVVGYHGEGGKEIFIPPFAHGIERGNILKFVKTVQREIERFEKKPLEFLDIAKNGSEYIHKNFTSEREEEDLIEFWDEIVKKNPLPALKK